MSDKVRKGNIVKVDYEGKLDSGEVFDTSQHGDHSHPIEFEVGSGKVIPGFDSAVLDMKVGEEKEFKIPKQEAYGEYQDNLTREIPRSSLPQDQEPKPGMILMAQQPNGQQVPLKIKSVSDDKITIDLNHPLAGQDLTFKIKVIDIQTSENKEEKNEKNE
jgi:peptidylprolyl isomerase